MRRLHLFIDDDLDDALAAGARRRGMSKAALIREAVAGALGGEPGTKTPDGWTAMAGLLADYPGGPVADIDSFLYGPSGR